jgi:rRNA maturation protein Rpf1
VAAPEFEHFQRGKTNFLSLCAYAHSSGADRLWLVSSRFGVPKLVDCYDTTEAKAKKVSSLLMNRVMLRRELQNASKGHGGHLAIVHPDERVLSDVYYCLMASCGDLKPGDGPVTELRISPYRDCLAELNFVNGDTGAPFGPKILLRSIR